MIKLNDYDDRFRCAVTGTSTCWYIGDGEAAPGTKGAVSTVPGANVRFATVLAALTFIGLYTLMAKVALPRM